MPRTLSHAESMLMLLFYRVICVMSILSLAACLGGGGSGTDTASSGQVSAGNTGVAASIALLPAQANGSGSVELTAVVKDSQFTPLKGATVYFSFSGDNRETLAPASAVTQEDGSAQVKVTDVEQNGGEATVVARVGNLSASAVVKFSPTSSADNTAIQQLELAPAVLLLPTDGQGAIEAKAFALANRSSLVPLANARINANITGPATLDNTQQISDVHGVARFTVTGTGAGTATLRVASSGVLQTALIYLGAYIEFTPETMNASGKVKLRALLKDGAHAPLAGIPIHFRFAEKNHETLQPVSATTGQDGSVEVEVMDVDDNGGTATVIAQAGNLPAAAATVNFLTPLGSNRKLSIEVSDSALPVGQTATVQATVQDLTGVPAAGVPIEFSVTGQANLSVSGAVSDAQGRVTATVRGNASENVRVVARAGTVTREVPLYFGAKLQVSPAQATATANSAPATLTATIVDATGAGVPGQNVQFSTNDDQALLDKYHDITNDIGQATLAVRRPQDGETQITVRAGAYLRAAATARFNLASSGEPRTLRVTASANEVGLNGTVTIRALALDEHNRPVAESTPLLFSATLGSIVSQAFTDKDGVANAVFYAGTRAGAANVKVSAPTAREAGVAITIAPSGQTGGIELVSVEPATLGIRGSGVAQTATLQFRVTDAQGNPVADNVAVQFALDASRLHGGETISAGGSVPGASASANTRNGLVTVNVHSGMVAGTLDVIATVNQATAVGRVSIAGGAPDGNHLSLAAQYLNVNTQVLGLEDAITAIVGDRFGNVVADGTRVNFISEGGLIGRSQSAGAFTATTTLGRAGAVLQTAEPTTPNLTGVAPAGNPGLNRVVVFTTGSESFVDANGNGEFDAPEPGRSGDSFTNSGYIDSNSNSKWDFGEAITGQGDISEPYVDANDSGTFEAGELYIDANQNNRFDGPDGVYQANTVIWKSINVLFSEGLTTSGASAPCVRFGANAPDCRQSGKFTDIANGSYLDFELHNLADRYSNALVAGTRVEVTTTGGVLGGTTLYEQADSHGKGSVIHFTLTGQPATYTENNPEQGRSAEYPLPSNVTVTIRITMPNNRQAPGGLGEHLELSFSGIINANAIRP